MKVGVKNIRQLFVLCLTLFMALTVSGCAGSGGEKKETAEDVVTVENTVENQPSNKIEESDNNGNSSTPELITNETEKPVFSEESSNQEEVASFSENSNDKPLSEETSGELMTVTPVTEDDNISTSNEIEDDETPIAYYEEEKNDGLSPTMRNSINMLNYMTSLTQQVNQEKSNQLFLESAYNSFDNLYPNSVDTKTQAQITSLMDTIQGYRMISVKRDRLRYIYEQNRAQALRAAIPNPVALLSAVQSGSILKAAASVLYMAVDSGLSYKAATSQADLQFIKDGWELDDEESAELHNSTKNALSYMFNMVRDYDIPGDYALNKSAVENFVSWASKPDSDLVRKISWFETNINTYSEFGPYWLELAKDYYNYENYEKCLEAVSRYEAISTRIFRKNKDYAITLPMAIISAKNTMSESSYVKLADNYCKIIQNNAEDSDWALRYFVAQIYMDLYNISKNSTYLDEAYKIARENVVVLVDVQRELNASYLADVKEAEASKSATKREKEEVKKYNKTVKEERKIALPPVSEALYLNSDLLFALAEEKKIDASEKKKIEAILHVGGENAFLTQALDDRFWFNKTSRISSKDIEVSFEGDKFIIPASCVTDRSSISVTVSRASGITTFDAWTVAEVKRPKKSTDCSEFKVTFKNKAAEKFKYAAGDSVKITVVPIAESPDKHIDFNYKVVATKKAVVLNGIKFERVE